MGFVTSFLYYELQVVKLTKIIAGYRTCFRRHYIPIRWLEMD